MKFSEVWLVVTWIFIKKALQMSYKLHIALTSCLNAHSHNTCIHLPVKRLYCAKNDILLYWSRSPYTHTRTSRRYHGNHHNNQLKCMSSVIIVAGKCSTASACNNYSHNITVKHYLGTVRILQPKTKQSHVHVNMKNMDFLPPSAPT